MPLPALVCEILVVASALYVTLWFWRFDNVFEPVVIVVVVVAVL